MIHWPSPIPDQPLLPRSHVQSSSSYLELLVCIHSSYFKCMFLWIECLKCIDISWVVITINSFRVSYSCFNCMFGKCNVVKIIENVITHVCMYVQYCVFYAGNLITALALLRCPKLRGHATTTFVLSLCVSDLLFCSINLPLTASRYLYEKWILGDVLCQLFPVIFYGNVAVSLLSMVAITLNRSVQQLNPCLIIVFNVLKWPCYFQICSNCILRLIRKTLLEEKHLHSTNIYLDFCIWIDGLFIFFYYFISYIDKTLVFIIKFETNCILHNFSLN